MTRSVAIWIGLAGAAIIPLWLAGLSPLLAWRGPIYITAGFCGVIGLVLLLFQPLLASRSLPNLSPIQHRKLHRVTGVALILTIILHVGGLWVTSPPDVIDALMLASPTPFSIWGVIAMWAAFATAIIAKMRRRISLARWRLTHKSLAIVIVIGTVMHAVLIQGTMESISKWVLCALVVGVTIKMAATPKP